MTDYIWTIKADTIEEFREALLAWLAECELRYRKAAAGEHSIIDRRALIKQAEAVSFVFWQIKAVNVVPNGRAP